MAETGDPNMENANTAALAAGGLGISDSDARLGARSEVGADAGARAARLDAILRDHGGTVLRLARRLLGGREDAEDAAQESFLRLYGALDRLDPARPVLPYLYRLTVNVCRDARSRGGRRPRPLPLDAVAPADEPLATGADPAEAARLAEERRIAAAALRALPEKQREALVLRDVHGLSTREVADALGIAEVTVRTQISRARLKVRELRDRALGLEGSRP